MAQVGNPSTEFLCQGDEYFFSRLQELKTNLASCSTLPHMINRNPYNFIGTFVIIRLCLVLAVSSIQICPVFVHFFHAFLY